MRGAADDKEACRHGEGRILVDFVFAFQTMVAHSEWRSGALADRSGMYMIM